MSLVRPKDVSVDQAAGMEEVDEPGMIDSSGDIVEVSPEVGGRRSMESGLSPQSKPFGVASSTTTVKPPVLVECPACQTKFTVSRAALNSALMSSPTPSFHCSRCDFVFSRAADELTEVAVKPVPAPRSIRDTTQPFVPRSLAADNVATTFGADSAAVQTNSPTTFASPASFNPAGSFSPASKLGDAFAARSPSSTANDRQLPLSFDGNAFEDTGYTNSFSGSFSGNAAAKVSEPSFATRDFTERSVTLKDIGEIRTSPLADNPVEASSSSGGMSFKRLSSSISSSLAAAGIPTEAIANVLPDLSNVRTVARKLPMAAIVAPMAACLALLTFVSWLSISMPSLGGWMADSWVGRSESALGHGLVLRGVSYSKITLENGSQMGIISGSVYNGSGASIERATLEGVTFGGRGEELIRVKTSLGNRLNKAKIQSLTADMIEDLQSDRRSRNVTVRPGEGHPFIIAVPLSAKTRSFSARILNAK